MMAALMVVVGILLIVLGRSAVTWIIIIGGVLMLLSGILGIIDASKSGGNMVSGVISAVVGIVLIIAASLLADIAMILLGLLLIVIGLVTVLGTGNKISIGGESKSLGISSGGSRILDLAIGAIVLIMGIVIIVSPGSSLDLIVTIVGVIVLVMGLIDVYNAIKN